MTRLDAGVFSDWVELGRLYVEAGRLHDARRAALQAAATAQGPRDRSVALDELGNVLVAEGDLAGARHRYEECARILRRLSAAEPASAILQRDVSVSLDKLGKMLRRRATWPARNGGVSEGLEIVRRLAAAVLACRRDRGAATRAAAAPPESASLLFLRTSGARLPDKKRTT